MPREMTTLADKHAAWPSSRIEVAGRQMPTRQPLRRRLSPLAIVKTCRRPRLWPASDFDVPPFVFIYVFNASRILRADKVDILEVI